MLDFFVSLFSEGYFHCQIIVINFIFVAQLDKMLSPDVGHLMLVICVPVTRVSIGHTDKFPLLTITMNVCLKQRIKFTTLYYT